MNTEQIYEKLGGRVATAKLCGVQTWTTYKWDAKGVPSKHWQKLAEKLKQPIETIAGAKRKRGDA